MILTIILSVLGALVLAIVLVLVLPVQMRLIAYSQPKRWLRLELGVLGGLVPSVAIIDTARPKRAKRSQPKKPKARKRKGRRDGKGARLRAIRAAPGLVRGILRQIRVTRFQIDCTFGLGDPAETGQLYGQIAPFQYGTAWAWAPGVCVAVAPDFERARLDGQADVALAVTPVRLLPPAVRFAWAAFGPKR